MTLRILTLRIFKSFVYFDLDLVLADVSLSLLVVVMIMV